MTTYEKIISLGDEFISLINHSIVPIHILDWKVYYEAYLMQKELLKNESKGKKEEAVNITTAKYDLSRRTMYRIIKYMEN